MTITDNYVPFKCKGQSLVEEKAFAKVAGRKASVYVHTWRSFLYIDKK